MPSAPPVGLRPPSVASTHRLQGNPRQPPCGWLSLSPSAALLDWHALHFYTGVYKTDSKGSWSVTKLYPGNYSVQVDQLTGGWTRPTYDLDSGKIKPDGKTLFLATSASTNSSIDFGYSNTSSLSGYVYVDANNNGVREAGESPIGNVLLLLTGQTAFGRFISQTVRSDASGYYSFSNLPLGLYTLTEVQPRNFVDGKDSVGKLALVGIVENDRFRYIPLKAGVAASDFNFGELKGSSIAGRVYVDSNRNGILDNGEAGLAFVLLKLEGTDDRGHHVIKYTPTASDGSYHFADLRPGTYSIQEYQPTRYVSTKNQAGSRGGVVANDLIRGIALTSDVRATDYLFGERRR